MGLAVRTGPDNEGGQASLLEIVAFRPALADAALGVDVSLDSDLVLQTSNVEWREPWRKVEILGWQIQ